MKKIKFKIIAVMCLFITIICAFSVTSKSSTEYVTFANKKYDNLVQITMSSIKDETFADTESRQKDAQTACMHSPSSSVFNVGKNKIVAYIDINKDGSDPYSATITGRDGIEHVMSLNANEKLEIAKLAYISVVAESRGQTTSGDAWECVWSYLACWESGGLRRKCQTYISDVLPNNDSNQQDPTIGYEKDVYQDAKTYAQNGQTSDGKVCSARIFLFTGDTTQAIALMSGKTSIVNCDVSVKKEIVNDRYQDRGNEVEFKITITNNGVQNVNMNVADTYNSSYFEDATFDSGTSFSKRVTVNAGSSKDITVKMKIKDNVPVDTQLINTVTISDFKIGSSSGESINNKSGNKETDSDYYYAKKYKVSINKYIYSGGTATSSRENDKTGTVYGEAGDNIVFAIKISNTGSGDSYGSIKNVEIKDELSNSDYVTLRGYYNGSSYVDSLPSGWSTTTDGYKYTGSIKKGESQTLYIKYNVNRKNESKVVKNEVTIKKILNRNNVKIYDSSNLYMDSSSTFSSSDEFTVKTYKVSITKSVDKEYAETGDTIEYTVTVKNEGSGATYGNITGIKIGDIFDTSDLTFVAFKSKTEDDWITNDGASGTDKWSKSGNIYTYGKSISPGNSASFQVKFTVNKKTKTNESVTNTVRIRKIQNKNDIIFYKDNDPCDGTAETDYMASGSNFSASASTIIKKYTLNVSKTVNKIYDANNNALSSTYECEMGDTVEFKIDIKNTGTNSNLDGKVQEINLSDYFDSRYLEYVSISGTGWTKNGDAITSDNKTTIKFKYTNSNGLDLGTTTTLYVKLKVKEDMNPSDLINDVITKNTAEIKTTDAVKNTNSIDIRDVLNGTLKSEASIKILSYHIKVNKYITQVNSTSITGRDSKNITQRYDDPVEVEKTDTVIYTIRLESTGAGLKNMTITDTLESGLEFYSATASVISAKKYSATNTEGTAITITESNTTTGSKDLTYSDTIANGEYVLIDIKCNVVKTNMYLLNLKNEVTVKSVQNRNDVQILSYLQYDQNDNIDYVRLKNLVISGTVWLDANQNGIMESTESKLEGINVILHDNTNNKIATTTTNSDGYYIFNQDTNGTGNDTSKAMIKDGRVIKATNRDDTTGNYNSTSSYINYYVEFYYNGVKYESTVYSGEDKIANNNAIGIDYQTDSNAREYDDLRTAFDNKLETIGYNKGLNANKTLETSLTFTKENHISTLNLDDSTKMSSYSFVLKTNTNYGSGLVNGSNIDMLFLKANQDVETEYLKYINLGLYEREKLDLRITNDLTAVEAKIKGETLTYEFGQLDQSSLYYKKTGNAEDIYSLNLYESDYYYRYEMYKNTVVRDFFGTASELELSLIYKITLKNESPDETYAKIREVVNYYSSDMQIENIYLGKTPTSGDSIDGTDLSSNISTSSEYNTHENYSFTDEGYTTTFIRGLDNIVLQKGQEFEIYVKYSLSKYTIDEIERSIKLGEKVNVAEISAYSTYTDTNCEKAKGLVDIDSNVGNIQKSTTDTNVVGITDIDKYEDDTFRIRFDLELKADGEREITGMVFEDSRSESAASININEFFGNGLYNTSDTRNQSLKDLFTENGMARATATGTTTKAEDSNALQDIDHDKKLSGMTVELIEIVEVDGEIYEETLEYETIENKLNVDFANVIVRTNADGDYTIKSFTPGTYLVRFKYGDIFKDNTISENSLIHNGQDYKSTTYTLKDSSGNVLESTASNEDKYSALTEENKSDARDNEYRRLEIMQVSETMINTMAEFMKYTNYDVNDVDGLKEFSEATSGFADTVTVKLGIENVSDRKESTNSSIISILQNVSEEYIENAKVNNIKLSMNNVDYGVTYRPENLIELTKKIKSITLTTSAGETLVSIKYNEDGSLSENENQIGIDMVQSVDTTAGVQGFRYINIDEDLMQGASISIEYYIIADNIGEVDTVNSRLVNGELTSENTSVKGTSEIYNNLKAHENVLYSTSADNETLVNYSRVDKLIKAACKDTTYTYGRYLGGIYYNGNDLTDTQKAELTIASLVVERIIDWVDNDAEFAQANNNTDNKYWTATTETELLSEGLIRKETFVSPDFYVDEYERRYTTDTRKNIALSSEDATVNPDFVGDIYPNKALSYDSTLITSRYITIEINANLSAGEDEKNMVYDNVAEVAKFKTITGRRTNFVSTIGNIKLTEENSTPFKMSTLEVDAAGTETVNLIPPTGSTLLRLFIAYNLKIIMIIISIIVIMTLGLSGFKVIKLKKKFYK